MLKGSYATQLIPSYDLLLFCAELRFSCGDLLLLKWQTSCSLPCKLVQKTAVHFTCVSDLSVRYRPVHPLP